MGKPELRIPKKKYSGESTIISMRLSKDLVKDIDAVAADTGRTRNEILQICIEFALEHLTTENSRNIKTDETSGTDV